MNRRVLLFLLLYVAAILYLSLYPWKFVPQVGPRTLQWVPLVSRRTMLDAFLNVVFYIPLGAAAFGSFRQRGTFAFISTMLLGTLIALAVELAQLSIPTRFGNLTDLMCDAAGTLLGVAAVFVATLPEVTSRLRTLHFPSVLLVGLWATWQAFLFLPRYGPTIDISREMVGFLVLALLAYRRPTRAAAPLLAWLAVIWLAVDELRPFEFREPAQQFWWLPFESWFVGALESYYGTFFGKLFLYTAVLWMERRAGIRWIRALAVPGAILLAGEYAQRYLPGRTPESTDVFLLLAGAALLQLAGETKRPLRE